MAKKKEASGVELIHRQTVTETKAKSESESELCDNKLRYDAVQVDSLGFRVVCLVFAAVVGVAGTWFLGEEGFRNFSPYSSLYPYPFPFGVEKSPVVTISTGDLQGFVSKSRSGKDFYSFLGIPFASPPVGKLRFESPIPAASWEGLRPAFSHGAECKQYDFLFSCAVKGDEDCLYLNVFTHNVIEKGKAKKTKPTRQKKVLVFLHGGALQSGSAHLYGPDYFMDHDNIIFVTIHYRLGALGFLSSGDEVVKGNAGFRDQVRALQWIQENIVQFHGDPSDVTIIGESAGAASVHVLMLSKMAQGLFHRGISWSTNILAGGRHPDRQNATEMFQDAALALNCSTASTRATADCLKTKSADEILNWQWDLDKPDRSDTYSKKFYLTIEKHNDDKDNFLSENPLTLMQTGRIANPVPWLFGTNDNECLIWVAKILQDEQLAENLKDENYFDQHLAQLMSFERKEYPREIVQKIRRHYFPNGSLDLSRTEDIQQMAALMNDKDLVKQYMDSTILMAQKAPVYLFQFSYRSSISFFNMIRWGSPLFNVIPSELSAVIRHFMDALTNLFLWKPHYHFGVSHADELPLLFNINPVVKMYVDYYDIDMSRQLVQTVVDFTTTSNFDNFNFKGVKWPKVDSKESSPMPVMDINSQGRVLIDPFNERLKFWKSLNMSDL